MDPKNNIKFSGLGLDLADFKLQNKSDNLIPNDDSTNIIKLYQLLKEQFKVSLFDYYKFVLSYDPEFNYFQLKIKLELLNKIKFLDNNEYNNLLFNIENKIIEEILPKYNNNTLILKPPGKLFESKIPLVRNSYVNLIFPNDINKFIYLL
jgi:hypothetical protein